MNKNEKLFEKLFASYYAITEVPDDSRASIVLNLATNMWQKISGHLDVAIFEPELVPVRGDTSKTPQSMRSLGNERFRIFLDKNDKEYIIIVKKYDWQEAHTCILVGDTTNQSKPFEKSEVLFVLESDGFYRIMIRDTENNILGDISLDVIDD